MLLVTADDLRSFVVRALVGAGATASDAELTAEVLVAADLGGVESHGVARLRRYVQGLLTGDISCSAPPEVVAGRAGVSVIDARNGLGQPALCYAVDLATARAREYGVGLVMVRRSNHMGIAGWFAERAARRGMLAVVGTNAVPQVAPIGTGEPMFGTDALSYAVPTGRGIICYDGALSVVSRGKLEQLGRLNERMRPGWAIDPSGREVTDPAEAVAGLIARKGYALLPLGGADQEQGGHKGSGLALLVELICGPLAGARWSNHTYEGGEAGLGHFALCIDLKALGDTNVVFESISDMALELRGAQPRDGKTTVRVPGDRRHALTEQRLSTGIPLLESVIEDLHSIAAEIRIEPLEFLVTKEIGGDNRR